MKIIILRTSGNIVNLSNYNLQEIGLAKAFLDLGHQCDVVYFAGNNKSRIQEIDYSGKIIRIFWEKGISIAGNGLFFRIGRLLKNYDVIQVSEYDQLMSIYLAFFSKYREKVTIYHGPYINEYTKKYSAKCKIVDKLPISKSKKKRIPCFVKSVLAEDFLIKRGFNNVTVTGVGLDVERFNNDNQISDNVKRIVEESRDKFNLLYVGRIDEFKNVLLILEILNDLKCMISNVHLILVGTGDDKYVKICQEYIEKYNLNDLVTWVSHMPQDQIKNVYYISNVFLLPTLREIFGMVMLESMYFKVPVITTYNGGSSTMIINGENGFILPVERSAWIDKIKELYNNRIYAKSIGENAHETIINQYTWNYIAEKMIAVYEDRKNSV